MEFIIRYVSDTYTEIFNGRANKTQNVDMQFILNAQTVACDINGKPHDSVHASRAVHIFFSVSTVCRSTKQNKIVAFFIITRDGMCSSFINDPKVFVYGHGHYWRKRSKFTHKYCIVSNFFN